jgi:hypothetical protein
MTRRTLSTMPLPGSNAQADPDAEFAAWLGERLRRIALGATAALLTARVFWPSEPDLRVDAGGGLFWVFALLIVAGLAIASALIGGTLRARWSWVDAAVIALVTLVAVSASQALDRRPAINLAWEWGAIGFAYVLVRNLPRTRGESVALAGALAATAVAVSIYGLYQVGFELPELRRHFERNPGAAMRIAGVEPGTPAAENLRNRVLHSNEIFSTFGLANSLAGFLVGPLVVMLALAWSNLIHRESKGSRLLALALAVPPILAVLICLILTKSRSAYLGFLAALLVLAWRERRRVRARTIALAGAGALAFVALLVAAGLATGQLDRLVLTQSGKSLRFRQEYWIGAWAAINETSRSFWRGYGPGNFLPAYLRHKLPQASEEINDPHNLVLEVWATAGVWAALALGAAIVFALRDTLGPPAPDRPIEIEDDALPSSSPSPSSARRKDRRRDPSDPPDSPGWLVASAFGGWLLVLLVGQMSLIRGGQFDRWMILGVSWAVAVGCGLPLWRRRPLEGAVLGASALAVLVNLLAAGGIGVPTVALALWTMVALGLNLRDDRGCGRLRALGGRVPAFGAAAVWVALLGTFIGAITPFWKAEAAMAEAEDALNARPPDFPRAEAAYERAKNADKYSARPWMAMAGLEYEIWKERGSKKEDLRWKKIPIEMLMSVEPPRAPNSWSRHLQRARMTGLLLKQLGGDMPPLMITRYRADVVHATRTASRLYPTNASLRARLAEASADIGMTDVALKEGREALRLDALTPHADKKLEPAVRQWLDAKIPEWEKTVGQAEELVKPKAKPKSQ